MSSSTLSQHWKTALIPVLILILGCVVWFNYFATPSDQSIELTSTPQKSSAAITTSAWNSGRFQSSVAYNPFQVLRTSSPETLAQPTEPTSTSDAAAEPATTPEQVSPLQQLASQPVTLLIRKSNKDIAIIGDQTIHSGQIFESGQQVKSIEMERILLSEPDGEISSIELERSGSR
jgi:cytoskeletal protein RodZ